MKGTLHWVAAPTAVDAEVRIYENLLSVPSLSDVAEGEDWKSALNSDSLKVISGCKLEPSLKEANPGQPFQFERVGYFCVDSEDSNPEKLVFNRSVSLREAAGK